MSSTVSPVIKALRGAGEEVQFGTVLQAVVGNAVSLRHFARLWRSYDQSSRTAFPGQAGRFSAPPDRTPYPIYPCILIEPHTRTTNWTQPTDSLGAPQIPCSPVS